MRIAVCSLALSAAAIAAGCSAPSFEPASLVIRGARVYSPGSGAPAEAIAIREDRILAVGSPADLERLVGPSSRVIDLPGGLVLPGFEDSHVHLLSGGLGLFEVDLFDATSLDEIKKRIRRFVEARPEEEWILGRGWRYTAMPDGRIPERFELDEVVGDRPAFMLAYDGHSAWVSSKALELAGIGPDTEAEGYGEIVKDPVTREPTGALKESGAMRWVRRVIPAPSRERKLEALRRAMKLLNGLGTVAIQNASGSEEELGLYRELLDRGELTLRAHFAISVSGETSDEELERIAGWRRLYDGPWLEVTGVKLAVDGVIESRTAAMLAPYADAPESRGDPMYTQQELDQLVARCHRAGLQVWIHAIGDRGVRMALAAFERARTAGGPADPRFRIEHIEVLSPEDLPRFSRNGVIASMQPIHADPDTVAVWSRAVGPERLDGAFPWKSLVDSGARLVFGTDWPASISVAPLRGIHSAVNRQTVGGEPPAGFVPAQRVSLETALAAFGPEAAYAVFDEERRGLLAPGMLADLVVLERDLFEIPAGEIHSVQPVLTIVGGTIAHESPSGSDAR